MGNSGIFLHFLVTIKKAERAAGLLQAQRTAFPPTHQSERKASYREPGPNHLGDPAPGELHFPEAFEGLRHH